MKKLILVFGIIFSVTAFAQEEEQEEVQEEELPQAINDIFNKMYPRATGIEWNEAEGNYNVRFESHSLNCLAIFLTSGEWVETIKQVDKDEIPKTIKTAAKAQHPKIVIEKGEFIENVQSDKFYKIYGVIDSKGYIIHVSKEGNVIKSEKSLNKNTELRTFWVP